MNSAVVLHNVGDARHCVKNKLHLGNLIFSTHSSVDVYLKEVYGLSCQCLSKFLDKKEVLASRKELSEMVDKILYGLEGQISPSINSQLNLKMRYFIPLYSYVGKLHSSAYIYFARSIKKVIDSCGLTEISFYDYRFDDFFDVSTDMGYFTSLFFGDFKTRIITHTLPQRNLDKTKLRIRRRAMRYKKALSAKKVLSYILRMTTNTKFGRFFGSRKTILLCVPLYDLEFLSEKLNKYNIIYYPSGNKCPVGFKYKDSITGLNVDFGNVCFAEDKKSPFVRIFLKDIKEDFLHNIIQHANSLDVVRRIQKKYPISLGIWGNPPVKKVKALVFEYLNSEGIRIVGAQHGSVYGDSFEPWHFDSDFNRCNHFMSYGFTEEDLRRLYPDKKFDTRILPFGSTKSAKMIHVRKDIDILFPVTISTSMFTDGMTGVFSDRLVERQIRLLEYLNSSEGFDTYIKPFAYSTYGNCSILPILKRLKNLKVVDWITLTEFLERYNPRAVLIEYPSTPLFDVLHLDAEIFLMGDYLHPFEKKAFEKLRKRVHYSEDIVEIISKINLFLKGKLEKKRDNSFYNHYVHKENAKGNILRFIDELLESTPVG